MCLCALSAVEASSTVGLLADIQQSISFVRSPGSPTSQETDRNTQAGQTHYISTLCSTAVQINVKETLRKWIGSQNGPESPLAADILEREACVSLLVFCFHLRCLCEFFGVLTGCPNDPHE